MASNVQVTGFKRIQGIFAALPQRTKRTALSKSLRAAAKPAVKAARQKVPKRTGQLKKSLGASSVRRYPGRGVLAIGAREGFDMIFEGRNIDPFFYSHLVEYGTVHSKPQPFMRPALDSTKDVSFRAFNKKMIAEMERLAKAG